VKKKVSEKEKRKKVLLEAQNESLPCNGLPSNGGRGLLHDELKIIDRVQRMYI
jgi:hypothetical protein